METRPRVPPHAALAVGILAVSTGAIFARAAESAALVTAAYRMGIAALVVLPFACRRAGGELRRLSTGDWLQAALSGFFLALHFAAWISSLDYTSVASSVVLVNTIPIWVGILSPLMTAEGTRPATRVGICLSVAGGIVIATSDAAGGERALLGDLLALVGGVAAALYLLMGRRLRRRLSILAYLVACYGSAAVFLWLAVLGTGLPVAGFDAGTWGALWGMALVAQIVGHSVYNWALKWFSAGMVAIGLLGEPVGATLMAYLFFGEGLTVAKCLGGVLILAAIWIAATAETTPTGGPEAGGPAGRPPDARSGFTRRQGGER